MPSVKFQTPYGADTGAVPERAAAQRLSGGRL